MDPRHPTGYFENEHGEQGVMQFEMETGICRVWMGDCGWDNEIRAEEINGKLLVRYLTPEEGGKPTDQKIVGELLDRWPAFYEDHRKACESIFGKLTDEQAERCHYSFAINRREMEAISDFYFSNVEAQNRFLRQREREEKKAEHDRQKQLRTLRRADKERLAAEEQALNEAARKLKREQREEVNLLREQIAKTKRLISGDSEVNSEITNTKR